MIATQKDAGQTFKITGDWSVQSKQLKEKFVQLTDADLKFEVGQEEDLLKRVETKLNKKREEVVNIIKEGQPEKVS
ncbi:MAG TPA: general stress protein CsbD [Cyclobacteriaceae bacterium]|nr:general stress protein CsbD [Cyclobacteriaceae bacterium]